MVKEKQRNWNNLKSPVKREISEEVAEGSMFYFQSAGEGRVEGG